VSFELLAAFVGFSGWIRVFLRLHAEVLCLRAEGLCLRAEGLRLRAGVLRVRAEGLRLRAEGLRLRAEGLHLRAEGLRLRAEGFTDARGDFAAKWQGIAVAEGFPVVRGTGGKSRRGSGQNSLIHT